MRAQQRTFIVSGGSSGLGRGTAEALAHAGAYVAVFDIAQPQNEVPSDRVKHYKVDISSTDAIQEAVFNTVKWTEETKAPLGGVVCCAGVLAAGKIINSKYEPLALPTIDKAIKINLVGTLDLIRLTVPHIAKLPESIDPQGEAERGVIIMVSSAAAYDGQPGSVIYSATKGAIRSLTLPLARDLSRYGIRAVSIAPNMFETAMTSKDTMSEKARHGLYQTLEFPRRGGKPEEFASLVLEICGNRMLNGCCLRIDGATRLPGKI